MISMKNTFTKEQRNFIWNYGSFNCRFLKTKNVTQMYKALKDAMPNEVFSIEEIRDLRNHFIIEKGLPYCAIFYNGKIIFFRNFGEGRYFLYSVNTSKNKSKIDKLRRIDENFDVIFHRKDISGRFYEKFKLKRNLVVRSITNDIDPVQKYLLSQKMFDRIFFTYFLCHKGLIEFVDRGVYKKLW